MVSSTTALSVLCTGGSLQGRCSTSDDGNESIEALEVGSLEMGSSTLGERQGETSPLPDEGSSTSESDQSFLAEQLLQVKLTANQRATGVKHAAIRHAALSQPMPMQVSSSECLCNKEMHELFLTLSQTQ